EVLVTAAILDEPARIESRHDRRGAGRDLAPPGPARGDSRITALEVDHAARMQWAQLRRDRDRLELPRRPPAVVESHVDAARLIGSEVERESGLRLPRALAGVELERRRIDRARIRFELASREAERILHARHVEPVRDQGDRGARRKLEARPGIAR